MRAEDLYIYSHTQQLPTAASTITRRVGELPASVGAQGTPLPILFGRAKVECKLIEKFHPIETSCPLWEVSTLYWGNSLVRNSSGQLYLMSLMYGTSSSSAGDMPTGEEGEHAEGTCKWRYVGELNQGAYPPRLPNSIYYVGDRVRGISALYECTTAGTSGDPGLLWASGQGVIYDGGVVWSWVQALPAPTYIQVFAGALCEGPISRLYKVYTDRESYGLVSPYDTIYVEDPIKYHNLKLANGSSAQGLPSLFDSSYYQNTAILYSTRYYSGTSIEMPTLSVEAWSGTSGGSDADDVNPKYIIDDLLVDVRRGLGWSPDLVDNDLTASGYAAYCSAMGISASLVIDSQRSASEILQDILIATNTDPVWSGGKLKLVPLGDTAIGVYEPANVAIYDVGPSDFLALLTASRREAEQCYNVWPIEYTDRAQRYERTVVADPDLPAIAADSYVSRQSDPLATSLIFADGTWPTAMSRILAQRSCYVRNEFTLHLPWRFCLLEPTDIITITDPGMGLILYPVRIVRIDEDDNGYTVIAEDYPAGVSHATAYYPQYGDGYAPEEPITRATIPTSVNGSQLGIDGGFVGPDHINLSFTQDNLIPNGEFCITSFPRLSTRVAPDNWLPSYHKLLTTDAPVTDVSLWPAPISLSAESHSGDVSIAVDTRNASALLEFAGVMMDRPIPISGDSWYQILLTFRSSAMGIYGDNAVRCGIAWYDADDVLIDYGFATANCYLTDWASCGGEIPAPSDARWGRAFALIRCGVDADPVLLDRLESRYWGTTGNGDFVTTGTTQTIAASKTFASPMTIQAAMTIGSPTTGYSALVQGPDTADHGYHTTYEPVGSMHYPQEFVAWTGKLGDGIPYAHTTAAGLPTYLNGLRLYSATASIAQINTIGGAATGFSGFVANSGTEATPVPRCSLGYDASAGYGVLRAASTNILKLESTALTALVPITGELRASSATYPPLRSTRLTSVTNTRAGVVQLVHSTSGDMADTFGVSLDYAIADAPTGTPIEIASVAAIRAGADNSGTLELRTCNAGTKATHLSIGPTGLVTLPDLTASKILELNASSQIVATRAPTATPTAGAIPVADGSGKLDGWVTLGLTNPMTAVGDTIYGGAAGVSTRLAGNATTAQLFLASTGDGANSAAPSWQALGAAGYADFGSGEGDACEGDDSRLSDARTPSAHAASHKHGGADEVATATPTADAIPKADSSGKLAAGWGGSASTLATLDSSSLVVQNPASASTTGGANKIVQTAANGSIAIATSGENINALTAINATMASARYLGIAVGTAAGANTFGGVSWYHHSTAANRMLSLWVGGQDPANQLSPGIVLRPTLTRLNQIVNISSITASRILLADASKNLVSAAAPTDASLSSVVAITTPGTWYDGPSISLAAGQWMIIATTYLYNDNASNTNMAAQILAGATSIADTSQYVLAHAYGTISLHRVYTLASTTTVKIQATSVNTSGSIVPGASRLSTIISAIQVG